jgi:thiamine transporter
VKNGIAVRTIVEAGMMLALATVLGQFIRIITLPYGGSVTAGSMIPLLLIGMMRGPSVGIAVGILYGIIDYSFGGWMVSVVQWLLDYPIAFGALGLAGVVWNPPERGWLTAAGGSLYWLLLLPLLALGAGLSVISMRGFGFLASLLPRGVPVWKYSLGYQASYLVPEIILSAIVLFFLAPPLMDFVKKRM